MYGQWGRGEGWKHLEPELIGPADVPNTPRWSLASGAAWLSVERLRLNHDA